MKIATSAYNLDWLDSWAQYQDKMARWVTDAADKGAQLLVFPEYGAMELATLDGRDTASDLEKCLWSVADKLAEADAILAKLAQETGTYILAPSGPARFQDRPVNRARLISPTGQIGVQDKQIMTRFEAEDWDVVGGGPLRVFDTALGKIGVLICYDSEFPLFARALSDIDLLLVPSCTEALAGYSRVRIGSMARALEQQCVSVMSSLVGKVDWNEAVEENTGRGGVFGPPDTGFPMTGVIAEGVMDQPGWTFADVDLDAIAHVRADGVVLNRRHWDQQIGREGPPECVTLS